MGFLFRVILFVTLFYFVYKLVKNMLSPGHGKKTFNRGTAPKNVPPPYDPNQVEDVDYEETHLQLADGDKIIFYTDGIVEAMNTNEEIYGFERLMEAVKDTASLSADDLLQKIKSDVGTFVGEAPQHDDLTVIILSVNVDKP